MKKVHKLITGFLLFWTVIIILLALVPKESKPLLYSSETCPNCKIVEKYLNENNMNNKIIKKDIADEGNRYTLLNAAQKCGIENVGVPLLTYKGKCYMGYIEVIGFLNQTYGEK